MAPLELGDETPIPRVALLLSRIPEVDLASGLGSRRHAALERLVATRTRRRRIALALLAAACAGGLALLLA